MTGPVTPAVADTVTDVTGRERLAIAPLVVLILLLGVYPKPVLALIEPSTTLLQTSVGVSDPAPIVGGTR
jgi:NADH-quinone oxidoreductase subunit M